MIYLKYGSTSKAFNELSWYSKVSKSSIGGVSLRGNLFDHIAAVRRVYTITISADAIPSDTEYDFLEAFFASNDKYISFNNSTWTSMVQEGGDMDVQAGEGIRSLPEVVLTLSTRAASASRLTDEDIF